MRRGGEGRKEGMGERARERREERDLLEEQPTFSQKVKTRV